MNSLGEGNMDMTRQERRFEPAHCYQRNERYYGEEGQSFFAEIGKNEKEQHFYD